jgi:hypothetical protein
MLEKRVAKSDCGSDCPMPRRGGVSPEFQRVHAAFQPQENLVLMDGYYPPDYFYDLIIGTLQYLPPKSISTMCSHTHTRYKFLTRSLGITLVLWRYLPVQKRKSWETLLKIKI